VLRPVFLDVSVFVSAAKGSEPRAEVVERSLGCGEIELVTNWTLVNELTRISTELKVEDEKSYRILRIMEELVSKSWARRRAR
jgi:predicted nucleic acid-binding protein